MQTNYKINIYGSTGKIGSKTLWPDLSKKELLNIINSFYSIERKYGL